MEDKPKKPEFPPSQTLTDDEISERLKELFASGIKSPQMELRIPLAILRANRSDAVMLLRMAAAVSAISGLTRLLSDWDKSNHDDTPSSTRDFYQLVVINASLLCEAIRLWRKYGNRPTALASRAIAIGYYRLDVGRFQKRLSTGPGSIYDEFLARWRDKLSFHWDPEPFEEFVDTFHKDETVLWRWPENSMSQPLTCYSPTVMAILEKEMSGRPDRQTEASAALKEVIDTQRALRLLFEATLFGFLIEVGTEPTTFVHGDGPKV